jgi:hypothetical protein
MVSLLARHCTLNLRNLAPAIEDEVFAGRERSLSQTLAKCDERPHRYDIGPAATAGPVEGVLSDKLWSQDAVGTGLVGRAVFAEMTRAMANCGRRRVDDARPADATAEACERIGPRRPPGTELTLPLGGPTRCSPR